MSLAALQKGVAAAAGIDASRGDTLAFSSMPFNTASAKQAAKAAAAGAAANSKQAMSSLIKSGRRLPRSSPLVLFLLWRSAREGAAQPAHPGARAGRPRGAHAVAGRRTHRSAAGGDGRDLGAPGEAGDVNRFIDSQPDDVATMLRSWLADSPSLTP